MNLTKILIYENRIIIQVSSGANTRNLVVRFGNRPYIEINVIVKLKNRTNWTKKPILKNKFVIGFLDKTNISNGNKIDI